MYSRAPVIIPKVQFNHSNGAHVINDGNKPVKGWARVRADALFKSFKLLPLDEKIDTRNEAIKRACEPAGGLKTAIARPPKRDVVSEIFRESALHGRSTLVFDEREMAGEALANIVENGRIYSVKAVALVRGVPLALHKSILFGTAEFWKKSDEFARFYHHLDQVPVLHPSAEKFNITGNDELLARGAIKQKEEEFEFSICVQNPRMEGRVKICDFVFIVTNSRRLSTEKISKIQGMGENLEGWLDRRFSILEKALARLIPPDMKQGAKIEWVLFREM